MRKLGLVEIQGW